MTTKKKVWVVTVEMFGYDLVSVGRTEQEATSAMFKEYRQNDRKATNFKTWAEVSEYFGAWVRECELGKAVWP